MVPERFVREYPQRCADLLELVEPEARSRRLLGSFGLMIAPAVLVIPYERMKARHPFDPQRNEPEIYQEVRSVLREKFLTAAFWGASTPDFWRFSRVMDDVNKPDQWRDDKGNRSSEPSSGGSIEGRTVDDVFRVLRNALAHGNIVYLDHSGRERPGSKVRYLAFLSRYEESTEQKKKAETYRIVMTTEESFVGFLRAWSRWLTQFKADDEIFEATAA